jgi:hypothetical protein
MPRVVHFELHADDPERAIKFYQAVFGWEFIKWEGPEDYWLINTGAEDEPGINGGLMKRTEPSAGTWNTVEVPSVDDYVERVAASGGTVLVPKTTILEVGYQAYCEDSEGNTFGIHQVDESAR